MSDERDIYDRVISRLETLEKLKALLQECRTYASQIQPLEEQISNALKDLTKDLDSMDVTSRGNFGWEARIVTFLSELRRRLKS